MRVVLTDRAIEDLIDIGAYIGRDDPSRAATFVAELERGCATLSDMPDRFPLLPGREASGVRRRRHGDDLIVYRVAVHAGRVEVLRVLDGARDYETVLFPGD